VIAVPDSSIAEVAAAVEPDPSTAVLHLSGALGLGVLAPHSRRGSLHPLVPLPDPEVGAARLRSGVTFAVAGDPLAKELVAALGGRVVVVADEDRALYHAAASIAANHVVAVLGQAQRVAARAGLPLEAFLGLTRSAVEDVARVGPAAAITGPAARGDEDTIGRHRAAIPPEEREGYDAGAALARRLAGRDPVGGPCVSPPPGSAKVISRSAELRALLDAARSSGETVGLVPTMGALHAGHRSLVDRAVAECDLVVVTVFVNPLQFNDAADLAAYPRDLASDVEVSADAGASIVFAPEVEEMYPGWPGTVATRVHVEGLADGLEGASRPGHFDGMATVVAKLFSVAGPCRAYFGEKDFQQLAIVRRMAADLSIPVEVVGCRTVREEDGLALSSRNVRLGPSERASATVLHRALESGLTAVRNGERDPLVVEKAMREVFGEEPGVVLDYAVAVDAGTLLQPDELDGDTRLLVAAQVGPVRLLDNEVISITKGEVEPCAAA
jgi:pantoate--beta-alanine ligase